MQVSLGWINKEGYSELQTKSFDDENTAYNFIVKHIDKIARINGLRIHRDFEDGTDIVKTIAEEDIRQAIREGV